MGSGHILVYMFDVLMDIYRSEGFSERDAAFSILENNIRGLDIDRRAYQLSYFALMMKARGYNRLFFRGKQDENGERVFVEPVVFAIEESNNINRTHLKYLGTDMEEIEKNNAINQSSGLLDELNDAKEYGSILHMDDYNWVLLSRFTNTKNMIGQISLETIGIEVTQTKLITLIKQAKVMNDHYLSVVTNPPYMGGTGMSDKLINYIKRNYDESKTDLYSAFIARCINLTIQSGYTAMITQHGWMFLSSFEKMRQKIITVPIINMLHLGARAFSEINGEVVQSTAFVFKKTNMDQYNGVYIRLIDVIGEKEKRDAFCENTIIYKSSRSNFERIPGIPYAYWSSEAVIKSFEIASPLSEIAEPRQGVKTLNNELFLKLWYEVDINKIGFTCTSIQDSVDCHMKWFPYNKGGTYRKWYGNNDYVVNWENDGFDMKKLAIQKYNSVTRTITNISYFFRDGLTWSSLTSGNISLRIFPKGYIFDSKGSSMFFADDKLNKYILAIVNSKTSMKFLEFLAPTLDFNIGPLSKLPIIVDNKCIGEVNSIVDDLIRLSKEDWNINETSWDFKRNPLIQNVSTIQEAYINWKEKSDIQFYRALMEEEKLNEIFIKIYGLEKELDSKVEEDNITLRKINEETEIKDLLSYAIGCMFGRYSIDSESLVFAGGKWESQKYISFVPNNNAIIPITETDYSSDDIVSRLEEFLTIVYGENTLEENINYIAKFLPQKGNTPKAIIRSYFINNFYNDHCNRYSIQGSGKRPIYWLFDSGKQNGFKCLIYMHRYNKDTLNLIRSEYLHKTEDAVENALKNSEYIIQTSSSAVEKAKATKDRDKYVKQLNEMRIYYQALSHLAIQKIEFDLDDGVKNNYQLFQGIEVIVDGGKKQKVDLLSKI